MHGGFPQLCEITARDTMELVIYRSRSRRRRRSSQADELPEDDIAGHSGEMALEVTWKIFWGDFWRDSGNHCFYMDNLWIIYGLWLNMVFVWIIYG